MTTCSIAITTNTTTIFPRVSVANQIDREIAIKKFLHNANKTHYVVECGDGFLNLGKRGNK
jgi:hypothetical protein